MDDFLQNRIRSLRDEIYRLERELENSYLTSDKKTLLREIEIKKSVLEILES